MSDENHIGDAAVREGVAYGVGLLLSGIVAWMALARKRIAKWWNAGKVERAESAAAMRSIAESLKTLSADFREKSAKDDEIIATIRDGFRALLDGHRVNAKMAELALESSPTPMWRCDAEGNAEWVNPACATYFGLPVREMLGSGYQARIHPDHRRKVREALDRTIMYHEPYNVEYAVRGERSWKNSFASGKPILSEDGKTLLGIRGIVEPVDATTERPAEDAA
jgi:PAS domain S-box-containing protein